MKITINIETVEGWGPKVTMNIEEFRRLSFAESLSLKSQLDHLQESVKQPEAQYATGVDHNPFYQPIVNGPKPI